MCVCVCVCVHARARARSNTHVSFLSLLYALNPLFKMFGMKSNYASFRQKLYAEHYNHLFYI